MDLPFRLLSVFARPDVPFSGNPLAVVERAGSLTSGQMQAIARQFNLSETSFILPADEDEARGAHARVRIFTPNLEMPFAGHPTLGTASVVAQLNRGLDEVVLAMPAGLAPVRRSKNRWVLTTPRAARVRDYAGSAADLAHAVGLHADELVGAPVWVDTGVEQLLAEVRDPGALRRATARAAELSVVALASYGESQVLLWARLDDENPRHVAARFFFTGDGSVAEDPATGSACGNLGGWLGTRGRSQKKIVVQQGDQVGRPSTIHVTPLADGHVEVGGLVVELGRGSLHQDQVV